MDKFRISNAVVIDERINDPRTLAPGYNFFSVELNGQTILGFHINFQKHDVFFAPISTKQIKLVRESEGCIRIEVKDNG